MGLLNHRETITKIRALWLNVKNEEEKKESFSGNLLSIGFRDMRMDVLICLISGRKIQLMFWHLSLWAMEEGN